MESIPGGEISDEVDAAERKYSEWLQQNLSLAALWFGGYLGTTLFAALLVSVPGRPVLSSLLCWPVFALFMLVLARRGERFIERRGSGDTPPRWTFQKNFASFVVGQLPTLAFLPALASAAKAPNTASPSFIAILVAMCAAVIVWRLLLKIGNVDERLTQRALAR